MYRKIFFFCLIFISLTTFCRGQEVVPKDSLHSSSLSDSPNSEDSLLKEIRSFVEGMESNAPFFSASFGVGNRLYSLRNDNINAQQTGLKQFAFTPMLSYTHKSGLGLSGMAYIMGVNGKVTPYQFALSPSYDHIGKGRVDYGLSYTHYFTRDDIDRYTTPIRNEFYGYVQGRKGWLEPGLTIGWAGGHYREVNALDTVIQGIRRHIVDTTIIRLGDFNVMGSLSHSFDWDDVFKKGDGFSLEPRLMLTAGSESFVLNSKRTMLSGQRLRRMKVRNINSSGTTGFQFQSAAFSLSASYIIGSWSFSPSYYVNYYFQAQTDPFTHLVALTTAVLF